MFVRDLIHGRRAARLRETRTVPCKVCDWGHLHRKSNYRLSGVVVFIGHILLVPCILGLFASGVMFFLGLLSTAEPGATAVLGLTAGNGLVLSLVAGLLGWLLIMKGLVLQCSRCGAVVPAS